KEASVITKLNGVPEGVIGFEAARSPPRTTATSSSPPSSRPPSRGDVRFLIVKRSDGEQSDDLPPSQLNRSRRQQRLGARVGTSGQGGAAGFPVVCLENRHGAGGRRRVHQGEHTRSPASTAATPPIADLQDKRVRG